MKAAIALFVIFIFTNGLKAQSDKDRGPELLNLKEVIATIVYPDAAKENKIEGKVLIYVLVDTTGKTAKTGDLSGPQVFYDEVRNKAKELKFLPAMKNGKKVKCWVQVPFVFKLMENGDYIEY